MQRWAHGQIHTVLCYILIQVNLLWIPYIIFKNTDSDEAVMIDGELRTLVAVTREGGFVRSGPEVADEVRKVEMSSMV